MCGCRCACIYTLEAYGLYEKVVCVVASASTICVGNVLILYHDTRITSPDDSDIHVHIDILLEKNVYLVL